MFDFREELSFPDLDSARNFGFENEDPFNNSIFVSDEETFTDTHQNHQETGGKSLKQVKHQKGKKVDDFDYKAFINAELARIDAQELDEQTRKRLIQKIRNRVSAQRSRNRAKGTMDLLKDENRFLRAQNAEFKRQIIDLTSANEILKAKLVKLETSHKSHSTTEYEDTQSLESFELLRTSVPNTTKLLKPTLFVIALCVLIAYSPKTQSPNVQLSGVMPLLTSILDPSRKQVQTLENYCRSYCIDKFQCSNPYKGLDTSGIDPTGIQVYSDTHKGVKMLSQDGPVDSVVQLMCYELKADESAIRTPVYIKKDIAEKLGDPSCYYYVPEIVALKMN